MPSLRRWRASVSRISPTPPRSCGNRPARSRTFPKPIRYHHLRDGTHALKRAPELKRAQIGKPSAWGVILAEGFSTQELWGALDRFLPELVVHARAPDVILDLDVARKDVRRAERRAGERSESAEVGVEELALDRPAVPQRVFNAATDGPTAARAALLVAGRNRVGG